MKSIFLGDGKVNKEWNEKWKMRYLGLFDRRRRRNMGMVFVGFERCGIRDVKERRIINFLFVFWGGDF